MSFWGSTWWKSRHMAAAWPEKDGTFVLLSEGPKKIYIIHRGQGFRYAESEYIKINMLPYFNRVHGLLRHDTCSPFRSLVCAPYHILSHTSTLTYLWYVCIQTHSSCLVVPLKSSFEKPGQIWKDYIYAPVYASYNGYTATCRSF